MVAVLTGAAWLAVVRRDPAPATLSLSRPTRPALPVAAVWLVLAAALLCWLVALPGIDPDDATPRGLLTGAPPTFAIALTLALAGFLAALRVRSMAAAVSALVLTGAVLRVTTALVSPEPMYDWTQKHLGVVDTFLTAGRISGSVDIYHDWPGLFAASAWLSDASGVAPDELALWFTGFITVLTALAVHGLARQLGADPWGAVVATYLFVVWNWIGQDYFAPQAIALLLRRARAATGTGPRTT
ncbi:hypothetical protein [Nocardioides alcanivorans]|uniref:hypothetical protein n=1 Tax=Nocardioides alcanivorans TaxID=2897352 RepID=UPI001F28574D|nr:hypothetical protein [Nocardioides alcanivorans]